MDLHYSDICVYACASNQSNGVIVKTVPPDDVPQTLFTSEYLLAISLLSE